MWDCDILSGRPLMMNAFGLFSLLRNVWNSYLRDFSHWIIPSLIFCVKGWMRIFRLPAFDHKKLLLSKCLIRSECSDPFSLLLIEISIGVTFFSLVIEFLLKFTKFASSSRHELYKSFCSSSSSSSVKLSLRCQWEKGLLHRFYPPNCFCYFLGHWHLKCHLVHLLLVEQVKRTSCCHFPKFHHQFFHLHQSDGAVFWNLAEIMLTIHFASMMLRLNLMMKISIFFQI